MNLNNDLPTKMILSLSELIDLQAKYYHFNKLLESRLKHLCIEGKVKLDHIKLKERLFSRDDKFSNLEPINDLYALEGVIDNIRDKSLTKIYLGCQELKKQSKEKSLEYLGQRLLYIHLYV